MSANYPPGLTQNLFDIAHSDLGDCIPDDDAPLPEYQGEFGDIDDLPALACGHLDEHFVYDPIHDVHICSDCALLQDYTSLEGGIR